jgi:hypothetical protein
MTTLGRSRVRIALDTTSFGALINTLTEQTPKLWRGALAQFEIGLFVGTDLATDLSNVESVTLEIRPASDRDGTPLLSKTLAAVSLDTTVNAATWADESKQHALFELSESDTNLAVAAEPSTDYWLVFSAVLSEGPVTLGGGVITIVEDGAGVGGEYEEPDYPYYTTEQSDARYIRRTPPNGSFRTDANGQHLQLWDPDLEQWRTLVIELGALALGAGED